MQKFSCRNGAVAPLRDQRAWNRYIESLSDTELRRMVQNRAAVDRAVARGRKFEDERKAA
jgi:hypothetical protein